jgi:hypothetical protein
MADDHTSHEIEAFEQQEFAPPVLENLAGANHFAQLVLQLLASAGTRKAEAVSNLVEV